MDIICCGICYSDISTMSAGWGPPIRPLVVGHEIVGTVTKVGKNVKHIKEGERGGVGAQSDSCRSCHMCDQQLESYCAKGLTGTYNGEYTNGSGKSFGGYATKWRGPGHFVIPVPDGLESHIAGPLMCGGVTIYSPLKRYGCGNPDVQTVGIVGIGGIGAFGLAFAKALGAKNVVAIGHSPNKKEVAMELGATDFISTGDGKTNPLLEKYHKKMDLIIVTANNADQRYDYLVQSLRPGGHVIAIAVPEKPVMPIPMGAILFSGGNIGGSAIGAPSQIAEMLQLAADKKPNFMIQKRKMSEANQAVQDMVAGKPRFRYCLINGE